MKHQITWRRTNLGGEELHHDFCANVDGNINVARILLEHDSERRPVWSCNMAINGASATCLTRSEAITWVEMQLDQFIEAHPDADPQEWVPVSGPFNCAISSKAIHAYAEMVAALRSGALHRIQSKA